MDLALLILRLWFGLALFFNHGLAKVIHFSEMAAQFPDPLGVGSKTSLALAALSEFVAAAMIVVGLGTRFAALIVVIQLGVAFALVHHFQLAAGPASGELAYLYIGAAFTLVVAGGGRFGIDGGKRA
jgi:putative oxidoreductase